MSMLPADAHRRLDPPKEVDVDQKTCHNVFRLGDSATLYGMATLSEYPDKYRCLAEVGGCLCVVEVRIRHNV